MNEHDTNPAKPVPSPAKDQDPTRPVIIRQSVLDEIVKTIGSLPPESGGLLGGNREEQRITRYLFDKSAGTSGVTYSPNTDVINKALDAWDADGGDRIIGFIHSHPGGYARPSPGDQIYAENILNAIPAMSRIFLPIAVFQGNPNHAELDFVINPYVAFRGRDGRAVIEPVYLTVVADGDGAGKTVRSWSIRVPSPFQKAGSAYTDDTFVRVRDAYDVELLRSSRIVAVGTGGAAEYIESLARAGVGQFVLIDPDTVSLMNLATQQTYRSDVGRPKVDVLAERIRDINPDAEVIAINAKLDSLNDAQMREILLGAIGDTRVSPRQTVLCGLTDFFPAQARVNRLALQFAVPSICAQVYQEGRGAEVTFTHPDCTAACHRCALNDRFKAQENGRVEEVGSAGTPIFATTRLNALKGFMTLALLHAGGNHPRWGHLLGAVRDRNLVLVRMDPDLSASLGVDVFDRTFGDSNSRIYFDETIWTTVTPDDGKNGADLCPECGGMGHLRYCEGTYRDTITGAMADRGWHRPFSPQRGVPPPLPEVAAGQNKSSF